MVGRLSVVEYFSGLFLGCRVYEVCAMCFIKKIQCWLMIVIRRKSSSEKAARKLERKQAVQKQITEL